MGGEAVQSFVSPFRDQWIFPEIAGFWNFLPANCLALQALIAFRIITAAFLDPLHAAVGIVGFVGVILIEAGVHAALAGAFTGIFRIDR